MGMKKFVESVKELLDIDDVKKKNKKRAIRNLLKKLIIRKEDIRLKLENKKISKKEKKFLLEELDIIDVHIEKGEKIIKKLNS
ncbi:MAG: hypothetical protein CSA86_03390 [Arcobacter sp.]|nr:MAG: hypothetical protein CSA86_03390 [Arcobacter sp.]